MKNIDNTLLFALSITLLVFVSCKDNSVSQGPPDEGEGETEIVDTVNIDLPADSGEVGLVINTREITRKGYRPTEAEVDLQDYPGFSETLEIDPVTNVAVFYISNEDLSEEQQNAFEAGTPVEVTIYDENQSVLTEYFDNQQVLDDSNEPLILETDMDYKIPPVILKEDVPYLLQPENPDDGSIIRAINANTFTIDMPDIENITSAQEFYLESVPGKSDTYTMKRLGSAAGPYFYNVNEVIVLSGDEEGNGAQEFVLEQDEDGWVRIREAETADMYVSVVETDNDRKEFQFVNNATDRFRFISANIEWDATDRGTTYHQPVTPPAQLDFAYEATIRNCTSGILTETVGNSETRISRRTTTTAEKLELFGGVTSSVDVSVGAEVGGDLYGAKATVNMSVGLEVSTSVTTSEERTLSQETEVSTEVSRTRSLEIPQFTGVEVYDAVRTVRGAKVPFTQVLRLTAQYTDGPALTGDEIMTQMLFNFVSGVPVSVGQDYVDVGIGGEISIENMYDVETGANELPDACD